MAGDTHVSSKAKSVSPMIAVVGLGPGGAEAIPPNSLDAMRSASSVLLRTGRHPGVETLSSRGIRFGTADDLYESADAFEAVYSNIASRVIDLARRTGHVAYAVPGHPLFGERSVRQLLNAASEQGIRVEIVGAADFLSATLEALQEPFDNHLQVLNAYDPEGIRPDPRAPTIVYQVDCREAASSVKLALMRHYPDEHGVRIVTYGYPVVEVPLFELDHAEFTHLTSVFVPPLDLPRSPGFYGLVEIVAALRGPGGCPWDLKQTHQSLKTHLVEETYEVLAAIDSGDPDKLCEELGDFLLQALMHAQIDNEQGLYDIEDVIRNQSDKLLRRHPHVFGGLDVAGVEDVLQNWDRIKSEEKGGAPRSALEGVPDALPALLRAYEVSKRAARLGFDWPDLNSVLDKVQEELDELRREAATPNSDRLLHEVGDLLFAVANAARKAGLEPEDALRNMLRRFTRRFGWMEAELGRLGRDPRSLTAEEWDQLWSRAKEATG